MIFLKFQFAHFLCWYCVSFLLCSLPAERYSCQTNFHILKYTSSFLIDYKPYNFESIYITTFQHVFVFVFFFCFFFVFFQKTHHLQRYGVIFQPTCFILIIELEILYTYYDMITSFSKQLVVFCLLKCLYYSFNTIQKEYAWMHIELCKSYSSWYF